MVTRSRFALSPVAASALLVAVSASCDGASSSGSGGATGSTHASSGTMTGSSVTGSPVTGSAASGSPTSGSTGSGSTGSGGGMPAEWLFTLPNDTHVHRSTGQGDEIWMGRGLNVDDLFLCGYNYGFWMTNPDGEGALGAVFDAVVATWHPTFFRVSLSMNSFSPVVTWNAGDAYRTAMTNVIDALAAHPNVYVLVTLRSDTSMVDPNGQTCGQGDDAICLPSAATDDVYRAFVDTWSNNPRILFGLSNEPGGNASSDEDIRARMDHAVSVIRAQEDMLGTPHHIVSVQGNQWTSKIAQYDASPLPYDNVVYEFHSYPPTAAGYTMTKIPVIVGEYGPPGSDTSFAQGFYADVEQKQIPNLAWDLAPYSNCAPDVVQVTKDASLTTNAWGDVVKAYLEAH
jgi:hypothetical protein